LLKNGRILGVKNNKLLDKGSQMTTVLFALDGERLGDEKRAASINFTAHYLIL